MSTVVRWATVTGRPTSRRRRIMGCDATTMGTVLRDDGFRLALLIAGVGSLAAWVWAPRRRRYPVPLGIGGVGVVAAAIALRQEHHPSGWLFVGLACLAFSAVRRAGIVAVPGRLLARVAGAVAVAHALPASNRWVHILVFVALVVGTPLVSVTDRRAPTLVPLLLVVSAVALYGAVPDTEVPRVLIGAFAPVALVALLAGRRPGPSTAAATALVVYAAAVGGGGASGAVVAGVACVGVLTLAPLTPWRARTLSDGVVLIAVHAGLVLWWSRVAGLHHDAGVALLLGLPIALAAWAALVGWVVMRRRNAFG